MLIQTHTTTNHVESMWCKAKQRYKKECGMTLNLLTTYLTEFIQRQKLGNDPFENFVKHECMLYRGCANKFKVWGAELL